MISVIIISYNSERYIEKCLEALGRQSLPVDEIIIIDNRSNNSSFLNEVSAKFSLPIKVIELPCNFGYAGAANAALEFIHPGTDYILYVAPDTFLSEQYVADGVTYLDRKENSNVGALSGILLGYDIEKDKPSGLVDSTGICQKWYGRWYDRDQLKKQELIGNLQPEEMPALCGTALMCRRTALIAVNECEPHSYFDVSLFTYKEDIDLSLRMRAAGYKIHFVPSIVAYHCRGWNRPLMSRRAKVLSARNEVQINSSRGIIKYIYSCIKLYVVSRGFF